MEIRYTQLHEIPLVMEIYAKAREFMKKVGNENQWINGYPSIEQIRSDIENKNSYVCVHPENGIVGVFFFRQGEDPTYNTIYEGSWLNDKPYGVVHRMASNGQVKGVANFCLEWCYNQCKNIRVDTHEDNKVMQTILEKNGYKKCGIIYVSNGTPRIAYQKI